MTDGKPRSKDPAAVALGRKRAAKMTPEEFAAFQRAGTEAAREANARRSPLERRMIAMRAWRTRWTGPAWMRAAQKKSERNTPAQDHPVSHVADQAAELARMIEQAGEDALEALRAQLTRAD
jgi:hypothetical protein